MTKRIVLLQAFASTLSDLGYILAGLEEGGTGGTAENWSLREVLCHLAYVEGKFQERFQRILTEDNPTVPEILPEDTPFDEDISTADALTRFKVARVRTVTMLKGLSMGQWQRPAVHATMGKTTLRFMVQMMMEHDIEHLNQIVEVQQAAKKVPNRNAQPAVEIRNNELQVVSIVEQISLLPNTYVGSNFSQGRQAVENHFRKLGKTVESIDIEKSIFDCKRRANSLRSLVLPYELPNDYLFFQDYFGGLSIKNTLNAPELMIPGIGPLADWYCGELLEGTEQTIDVNPFFIAIFWFEIEQTLDKVSTVRNKDHSPFDKEYIAPRLTISISFFIDVTGIVEQNSILMERSDQQRLVKVADSFLEWLKLLIVKEGRLETL